MQLNGITKQPVTSTSFFEFVVSSKIQRGFFCYLSAAVGEIKEMKTSTGPSSSGGPREYLPPENFAMVEPGVYRSAFPRMKNAPFLKRLKLKAVMPLVPEDYPTALAEFYENNGIKLISHGLDGNKWPFKAIDDEIFRKALIDVLNPSNRPVLIHCNKGKHRTGSLVGCIRKYRGWSLTSIFSEYLLYAAPKSRLEDQRFIEAFEVEDVRVTIEAQREELLAITSTDAMKSSCEVVAFVVS